MIRINLLRKTSRKPVVWTPESSRFGVYAAILLLAVVVGMAVWYGSLQAERAESFLYRDRLEQEALKLKVAKVKLEKREKLMKMLNDRIVVIERLRSNQRGPVLLMNGIISSIPEEPTLWLSSLVQSENTVTVEGRAFNMEAVADFIASLGKIAPFKQVDLHHLEEEKNSIQFALTCELQE